MRTAGFASVRARLFVIVIGALGAFAVHADDAVKSYDIEAQPMDRALRVFAAQTEIQVAFSPDSVDGLVARAVQGEYPPESALRNLIDDSGLDYAFASQNLVVVRAPAESEEREETSGKPRPASNRVLTAQNRTSATQSQNQQTSRSDDEANDVEETPVELDEIVVTGTTIRGVVPESAPLEIFTAEDIARSGATTLERFFETIPQNLNSITPQGRLFGPGKGELGESGIDLRGFGVGTTLILVNGRRLTAPGGGSPDISLIPLGAIERVELLTDGASAVYGADAIGGVVNIILRDDMDGAETSLSYGAVTDGGHHRFVVNQSVGTSWQTGKALISYGFFDQSDLTAGDRDFVNVLDETTLVPDERRHTLSVTAEQDVTSDLSTYGDILYSSRDSKFDTRTERPTISRIIFGKRSLSQQQAFLSAGFDYSITDDLRLNVHSSYLNSQTKLSINNTTRDTSTDVITFELMREQKRDAEVFDLSAKIDGKLIDLPAGELKVSAGAGFFNQEFTTPPINSGVSGNDLTTLRRKSHAVFTETFVPVISEDQGIPGIRRLEINAAARYTEYADFGSDVTPRFGLLWSPVVGLNFRGTYAESFRAPTLGELNPLDGAADILPLNIFGGLIPDIFSDDGSTVLLSLTGSGGRPLRPEFSESFTLGVDFRPETVPGLDISVTYFNIDYQDRIGIPDPNFSALSRPEDFLEIYNPNPSRADLEAVIAAYAILLDRFGAVSGDPRDVDLLSDAVTVIFDNRLDNLALSRTDGLDFSVGYVRDTRTGSLRLGGRATYTLDSVQAVSETSPEITLLDTVGNPTSFKFTANAGISRGGFDSQVNVNYVDSYTNVNVAPETPVDSWTTVDLSLRYDFGAKGYMLSDTVLSLNVNNLFDRDPPFVGSGFRAPSGRGLNNEYGYDPTNANPVGRFITIDMKKRF